MKKQFTNEILAAYKKLLSAAVDYAKYEHDGDPWTEDARAMGEMEIDDLSRSGELDRFQHILNEYEGKPPIEGEG